jgi:2-methylcitrate dehydratase
VTYLPIASAVGCSGILGLTPEQTEHAISLSLVGNIALRQTRVGTISDWKAACAAYAARSGLWAARLAKNGFTGPSDIFTGRHGFIPQVLGRRQGVRSPFSINGKWRPDPLSRTHMKFFPAEHHAQSAIEAAIQIHQRIRFRPEAVQSLTIQCFKVAVDIIGSEAEKWNPTTRETADHSLPYLVAAALLDGHITLEQFHKKRYLDPDVKILLKKIRVVDSKRYSRLYPKWMPSRVIIRFKDGSQVSEEVLRPKGYAGHPMTEQDVQEKFFRLAKNHLSENRMRKLVHKIKNLDRVDKLSSLVPLMRI